MKLCSFCLVWITFQWVNDIVILMLKPFLKVGITIFFLVSNSFSNKAAQTRKSVHEKKYLQDITWLSSFTFDSIYDVLVLPFCCIYQFVLIWVHERTFHQNSHPINLHPLFLFRKHGSVCDPEKNQVQNIDLKKQGHCYSKREEARLPLLFSNNNYPVFCNP